MIGLKHQFKEISSCSFTISLEDTLCIYSLVRGLPLELYLIKKTPNLKALLKVLIKTIKQTKDIKEFFLLLQHSVRIFSSCMFDTTGVSPYYPSLGKQPLELMSSWTLKEPCMKTMPHSTQIINYSVLKMQSAM